jgi:hypothetical protein
MSPAPADAIRSYLAERDEACPGCGYNLRGAQEPVCPECGREIRISIARGDAGRAWLLLLLVALGWVVIMGGLHTAKGALIARRESRVLQAQVLFSRATRLGGSVAMTPQIRRPVTTAVVGSAPVVNAAPSAPTIAAPAIAVPLSTGSTVRSFSTTVTAPRPTVMGGGFARVAPAASWSSVRWQTWTVFGVAAALTLAALAGLASVVRSRRRILVKGPSRPLWSYAAVVCGLYALGQIFLLARDLMG